ncbi:MAG: glucose-6-phosphate isomerase [Planctomycetota bacterium]|nr:glucose-6-phosphate isomerase [Planctomycetota bacterium]
MIQLYWKNTTSDVIGAEHGISPDELDSVMEKVSAAHRAVIEQWDAGRLGYAKLPFRRDYRDAVMELAGRYRGRTTDLVVLGIGGSALGNIALQQALNLSTYNLLSDAKRGGPRLFVLDNADPALIGDTLGLLGRRLKKTLFNVISKSGGTAETASVFMVVREMLRKRIGENFAEHVVATTDTETGILHDIASADGYATLPVPGDVGGRFSVLSPVGLFSSAMCGIDIDALLAGAGQMAEKVKSATPADNPACVLAAVKYLMYAEKGKPIHVMMPYSNRLAGLADWYRQLWAESLGKQNNRAGEEVFAGPTPVKALGATDQHSQIQLYREGPNDKLIVFLEVGKHPREVRIPDVFGQVGKLAHLRKVKISKLLNAEKQATEYALARSRRPSVTIRFDAITPESVGAFIFLYEFTTSLAGEMLDINAYDQPAVELGKKATFALLGGGDSEPLADEIRKFAKVDKNYMV